MLTPDARSDPQTPGAGTEVSVIGGGDVASVPRSLIIVRHGRTAANASGLLLGRHDPPLDEVGHVQADALAAVLHSGRFGPVAAVVSSPLGRTMQTATRIAGPLDLAVEVDERLIELDYGELEGTPVGEVATTTWTRWREDVHFRPPGGESLAELGDRVRACCEELAHREPPGGAIVVVSHVSPIKAALAWALEVDMTVSWRTHLDTASITRIVFRGGRPVLSLFNEGGHLV